MTSNSTVEIKHADAPFLLLDLGARQSGQYDASDPHRHDYYELFVFHIGGGLHRVDFKEHAIEKQSVHFISPGQVHQLKRKAACTGTVLAFTEAFYGLQEGDRQFLRNLPFFEYQRLASMLKLKKSAYLKLQLLLQQIQEEYTSSLSMQENAIRSLLSLVLIELKRNWPLSASVEEPSSAARILVKKYTQLIEQHFAHKMQVSAYADLLSVSASHLNDCCRSETGENAGALIQERMMLEAKRLLYNTDLSAKEIAHRLGYEDPAYFGRFFKKMEQVSPQDFRNNSRKKYQ